MISSFNSFPNFLFLLFFCFVFYVCGCVGGGVWVAPYAHAHVWVDVGMCLMLVWRLKEHLGYQSPYSTLIEIISICSFFFFLHWTRRDFPVSASQFHGWALVANRRCVLPAFTWFWRFTLRPSRFQSKYFLSPTMLLLYSFFILIFFFVEGDLPDVSVPRLPFSQK